MGGKLVGKETAHIIGEQSSDSQTQVRRYIRLTIVAASLRSGSPKMTGTQRDGHMNIF